MKPKMRIKEFREAAKLNQPQLGEIIHKSGSTIKSWEAGRSFPNADSLCQMCELFHTDPNTLVGWYDTHHREDAPPLTDDESQLVDNYRSCTPQWKTNVSMTALAAAGESLKMSESAPYAAEGVSA